MSLNDFWMGHYWGQEQAKQDAALKESMRVATSSGRGLDTITHILPVLEVILVGISIFEFVSTNAGLNGIGLHKDTEVGIFFAVIGGFGWFYLFAIPVLGSILNVLVSALWGTAIFAFGSLGWSCIIFLISVAMHYEIFTLREPDQECSPGARLRERLVLLISSLALFGSLLWLAATPLIQQGQLSRLGPSSMAGYTTPAVCITFIAISWAYLARNYNGDVPAKNWWPIISMLVLVASTYTLFKWTSENYLNVLAAANQSSKRPQSGAATSARTHSPDMSRYKRLDCEIAVKTQVWSTPQTNKALVQCGKGPDWLNCQKKIRDAKWLEPESQALFQECMKKSK